MGKPLHYYYSYWSELPEKMFRAVVREFLDNGADKFVITCPLLQEMLENREREEFLHRVCREMHVQFSAVHAPYGKEYDLNIPGAECRENMFATHIRAMQIAAGFGCRTYTIHMGAYHYCTEHVPLETLRPLARETLDKLIPTAQKLGMVIAVENSFEKPNSARETLDLIKQYEGEPAIGVCYDTGHAHCMASAPDKDKSRYQSYFPLCWWEEGVIFEDNALELLKDHVVTCHIHDNDGYGDLHGMPFDGTIDWEKLMPGLFSCPRMLEYQTEVNLCDGDNWAGHLLAPAGGYSIRRLTETFQKLGF